MDHDPTAQAAYRQAAAKIAVGLGVLVAVCAIGVLGYIVAGWSVADAAFMVIITIFGVGYGEVRPVDTTTLRILTGFVIVAGYGAVIYAVGGFIQIVVDGHIQQALGARRMKREIAALEGHTIICGLGRMGRSLGAELAAAGHEFVAIDVEPGDGTIDGSACHVIQGDATDESVLQRAGIDRAGVLATVLSDDAVNVFVTLTARSMNPDLTIIARGEVRRTADKLRTCGADQVVMPTDIGATRISQLIVRPSAEELLDTIDSDGDVDLAGLGLEFDEVVLDADSPLTDRAVGDIEVRGAHGYLIVGIRRSDGATVMRPAPQVRLAVGDRLIVLGYHDDMPELGPRRSASHTVTYRGATSDLG